VTNIPAVLQPSSARQWLRLLTVRCQCFTYQPIVFLRCEANAYFIGSGCAGGLFFLSGCRPRFSRLAASPLDARTGEEELKKKRDCSQSSNSLQTAFVVDVIKLNRKTDVISALKYNLIVLLYFFFASDGRRLNATKQLLANLQYHSWLKISPKQLRLY